MAVNSLRNAPRKFYNYLVEFGEQTVLHGPKYFLNHGSIEGGKEVKRRLKFILKAKDKKFILIFYRLGQNSKDQTQIG